jgi:hypothetical protein
MVEEAKAKLNSTGLKKDGHKNIKSSWILTNGVCISKDPTFLWVEWTQAI